MKHPVIRCLILLGCLGMIVAAPGLKEPQEAARQSLTILRALPPPVLKGLGFASKRKAKAASLGEPFEVYLISEGKLRGYDAGQDPETLLESAGEVVFPVYDGSGLPVSSIKVVKGPDTWKLAVFGGGENRLAEEARLQRAAADPQGPACGRLVQFLSLALTFLAFESDGILYFIPSREHPHLPFRVHEPVRASKVLLALRAAAEPLTPLPEKYSTVTVHYTAEKEHLRPGETTRFTVTFKGLDRTRAPYTFAIENRTPTVIHISGGDSRTVTILTSDIAEDGTHTLTLTLTGLSTPGDSHITVTPLPHQEYLP